MSAIGGAGLGKLTEIADNTDGLEITITGVELNTDELEAKQDSIIAEIQEITDPNFVVNTELIPMLRSILIAIANPSYVDKSANAIRNQIQSGTVTTVSTVTGLTNFGSQGADVLYRIQSNTAWAVNIRNLIT